PGLISDVQAWANDPTNNFGWLLLSEEGGPYSARHFATRENIGGNAPVLTIDFSFSNVVITPPVVTLKVSPLGTNFELGITLTNTAVVQTNGAPATNVEFFTGNTLLGTDSTPPFALAWTPTNAGLYSLTAVAFDALGQSGTSAPVVIRIHLPDS